MDVKFTLNFDPCLTPRTYQSYQNYYMQGLKTVEGVTCNISPFSSQILATLRDANVRGVDWVWKKLIKMSPNKRSVKSDHVGRYDVDVDSHRLRMAIDVADVRGIRDEEALEWCDIYFKANKWPSIDYPSKVRPIVNANGRLDFGKLKLIEAHRHTPKKFDLVYMSKLWSRADHFDNILEHQIRVFEVLAKLDCSKNLRAIIFDNSRDQLTPYLHRLDAAGVEWSTTWGKITSAVFWKNLAEAKIVFQRSGNHHCISWRMTDLLCMGACIVMDQAPFPQWPAPLEESKHFANCNCGFTPDFDFPPTEQYENISKTVEDLLKDEQAQDYYRQNSRDYFERHLAPHPVGCYIIDEIKNLA